MSRYERFLLARAGDLYRPLWWACCIYVTISLVLFMSAPTMLSHYEIDSFSYARVADYFYTHTQLRDSTDGANPPVYPLGYPLFVGLLYKLTGPTLSIVIVAQVLLALLTFVLLFTTAATLCGITVARYAVLAASIHVGFAIYAQYLMSEMLLVSVLTAFWYRVIYFLKTSSLTVMAQAAFLLGLSVTIKSIALFYSVPLIVILAIRNRKIHSPYKLVCTSIGLFCIPIIAQMGYNYHLYTAWQLSPQLHVNMYHYFLPKVMAAVEKISIHEAVKQLQFTGVHGFDLAGWDNAYDYCIYYVCTYPGVCIYVWLQNMVKTVCGLFSTQVKVFFNPEIRGTLVSFFAFPGSGLGMVFSYLTAGMHSPSLCLVLFFELLYMCVEYTLVMYAFLRLIADKHYYVSMLFFWYCAVIIGTTGFDGCARFRFACEPIFIILAAYAGCHIFMGQRITCMSDI